MSRILILIVEISNNSGTWEWIDLVLSLCGQLLKRFAADERRTNEGARTLPCLVPFSVFDVFRLVQFWSFSVGLLPLSVSITWLYHTAVSEFRCISEHSWAKLLQKMSKWILNVTVNTMETTTSIVVPDSAKRITAWVDIEIIHFILYISNTSEV